MIGSFDDGTSFLTAAPSFLPPRPAGASFNGRGRLVYNSARCPIKTNGGALASVSFINRCAVGPPLVTAVEFQRFQPTRANLACIVDPPDRSRDRISAREREREREDEGRVRVL